MSSSRAGQGFSARLTVSSMQGLPIDASSAGALQASLTELGTRGLDEATMATITMLATKPMQPAVYFCTGDEDVDASDMGHYALAAPMYTHFTSPIRRYADVVVHRLLAAALAAPARHDGAAAARAGVLCKWAGATCFTGLLVCDLPDRRCMLDLHCGPRWAIKASESGCVAVKCLSVSISNMTSRRPAENLEASC